MKIVNIMGSDKRVCEAARVSLNKDLSSHTEEQDIRLIRYLREHQHTSPFEHVRVTFEVNRTCDPSGLMHVFRTTDVEFVSEDRLGAKYRVTSDLNNLLKVYGAHSSLTEVLPASCSPLDATARSVHEVKEQPSIELYGGQGFCTLVDSLVSDQQGVMHNAITFLCDVPKFVAVQHMRHRTWSYNEVSRRYTEEDIRFWTPTEWRGQADKNLQASKGLLGSAKAELCRWTYARLIGSAAFAYQVLLRQGLAREQARAVLPQSMMTRYYATVSLRWLKDFIRLRTHEGAQPEIVELAEAMRTHAQEVFGDRL